jgi:hypothetical protein
MKVVKTSTAPCGEDGFTTLPIVRLDAGVNHCEDGGAKTSISMLRPASMASNRSTNSA